MKKTIISVIASLMVLTQTSVFAGDFAMGITANLSSIDTEGSETLRQSGNVTKASHEENVTVPEIFVEVVSDGGAFGLAYIPVQELGTKSRTDSNDDGDSGTYKADAELSSHVMLYADINMGEAYGATVYGKVGVSRANIKTSESLNSGSTYGDQDVFGLTIGLGARNDLMGNYFYKIEGTYTDYEEYKDTSTVNNSVQAETEIMSAKFSLGYNF